MALGDILWSHTFNSASSLYPGASVDSSGNSYILTHGSTVEPGLISFDPGGNIRWQKTGVYGRSFPAIDVDRGKIYVTYDNTDANGDKVVAYDSNGNKLWGEPTESLSGYFSPVIFYSGSILAGSYTGQYTYKFTTDGTKVIERGGYANVYGTPVVDLDGNYYEVDMSTLVIKKFSGETLAPVSTLTGDLGTSRYYGAIDCQGTYYYGDKTGTVYAIKIDGSIKWSNPITGYVEQGNGVIIGLDRVYFVYDKIYCVDKTTGTVLWVSTTLSDCNNYGIPSLDANGDIFVAHNAGISKLDKSTGAELWSDNFEAGPYAALTIDTSGTLFVASAWDKTLYAVDTGISGRPLGDWPMAGQNQFHTSRQMELLYRSGSFTASQSSATDLSEAIVINSLDVTANEPENTQIRALVNFGTGWKYFDPAAWSWVSAGTDLSLEATWTNAHTVAELQSLFAGREPEDLPRTSVKLAFRLSTSDEMVTPEVTTVSWSLHKAKDGTTLSGTETFDTTRPAYVATNPQDLSSILTLEETLITTETPAGTTLKVLVSFDGSTWQYWNGSEFTGGYASLTDPGAFLNASNVADLQAALVQDNLPEGASQLQIGFLMATSDSTVTPRVASIEFTGFIRN